MYDWYFLIIMHVASPPPLIKPYYINYEKFQNGLVLVTVHKNYSSLSLLSDSSLEDWLSALRSVFKSLPFNIRITLWGSWSPSNQLMLYVPLMRHQQWASTHCVHGWDSMAFFHMYLLFVLWTFFNRTQWHGGMLLGLIPLIFPQWITRLFVCILLLKQNEPSIINFAEFWQPIQGTSKRFNIGEICESYK